MDSLVGWVGTLQIKSRWQGALTNVTSLRAGTAWSDLLGSCEAPGADDGALYIAQRDLILRKRSVQTSSKTR